MILLIFLLPLESPRSRVSLSKGRAFKVILRMSLELAANGLNYFSLSKFGAKILFVSRKTSRIKNSKNNTSKLHIKVEFYLLPMNGVWRRQDARSKRR